MAGPAAAGARERLRALAGAVADPEIPVLTLDDLGVLRDLRVEDDGTVVATVTPTYSGCPAMDVIRREVAEVLRSAGCERVVVETSLAPAWTTDWLSADGRRKLHAYGVAPPTVVPGGHGGPRTGGGPVPLALSVRCPLCGSADTEELSRFGSTACKSLWRCRSCREPFDHLKPL